MSNFKGFVDIRSDQNSDNSFLEIGFYSYSSEIASFLASCVHREDDKSSPDEPWSTPPRGQSLVPRPCHTGGGRRGEEERVVDIALYIYRAGSSIALAFVTSHSTVVPGCAEIIPAGRFVLVDASDHPRHLRTMSACEAFPADNRT